VDDTDDIKTLLEKHAVGQAIAAGLVRGGAALHLEIVVGERPQRS
jgi:hypothetical protein